MKIYKGVFLDCNDKKVKSNHFLLQAENAVKALEIADKHMKDPTFAVWIVPNQQAFTLVGVEEVKFDNGFSMQ